MRKIKFRFWDTINNQMLISLKLGTDSEIYSSITICEIPNHISMQFTGLVDLDGKEVYEGDIIQFEEIDYQEYQSIDCSFLTEVKFSQYAFKCVDWLVGEEYWIEDMQNNGIVDGVVIGNIYNNHELLEV